MGKSQQTKVKEISAETKREVLERQNYRSISGVALTASNTEFHHYVFRSRGGVGYAWNIVGLTSEEHRAIHDHQSIKVNGRDRYSWDEFQTLIHNHLCLRYAGWSVDKCKYRKYWTEEDYQITRKQKIL